MEFERPLSSRAALRPLLALLLITGAGCAIPPALPQLKLPQPPDPGRRLNPKPTTFVRFYGWGPLPPLTEAVTYQLCFDLTTQRLADVLDPATHKSLDDVVPNLLRQWKWEQHSNVPVTGDLNCWLERFSPTTDAQGRATVRAEPIGSLHSLVLRDDESDDLFFLETPREDERTVTTIDVTEHLLERQVFLPARLFVVGGANRRPAELTLATRRSGNDPFLSLDYRSRHSRPEVRGSYRVCVDRNGKVTTVTPEVPVIGANRNIIRTLKNWQFAEQVEDTCNLSRFVFFNGESGPLTE